MGEAFPKAKFYDPRLVPRFIFEVTLHVPIAPEGTRGEEEGRFFDKFSPNVTSRKYIFP